MLRGLNDPEIAFNLGEWYTFMLDRLLTMLFVVRVRKSSQDRTLARRRRGRRPKPVAGCLNFDDRQPLVQPQGPQLDPRSSLTGLTGLFSDRLMDLGHDS